jgi:hypothetical protein
VKEVAERAKLRQRGFLCHQPQHLAANRQVLFDHVVDAGRIHPELPSKEPFRPVK